MFCLRANSFDKFGLCAKVQHLFQQLGPLQHNLLLKCLVEPTIVKRSKVAGLDYLAIKLHINASHCLPSLMLSCLMKPLPPVRPSSSRLILALPRHLLGPGLDRSTWP